jgi:hypothetical protein
VPHRPRGRHGDLPGSGDRGAPPGPPGWGQARFGVACSVCPLRQACTSSIGGRVVAVHPLQAELAAARARQRDPAWLADYRATRPKVERKLAHLLRRRHGGRRARARGLVRVAQDFKLLAAAVNLAPLPPSGYAPPAPAGSSNPPDDGDQRPSTYPGTATSMPQNSYNSSENTGHLGRVLS